MHPNFVSRLPRKVLGWFISTWSTLVYTNNFSLTRYLSVFVIRVDDQQVFLYNFPLTRFLRLGRRHDRQVFLDKFRLCLQCLMVSGVLRNLGPSLMPSQKQNGIHRKSPFCCKCARGTFASEKQGSVDGGFVRGQQRSGSKIKEWPII